MTYENAGINFYSHVFRLNVESVYCEAIDQSIKSTSNHLHREDERLWIIRTDYEHSPNNCECNKNWLKFLKQCENKAVRKGKGLSK